MSGSKDVVCFIDSNIFLRLLLADDAIQFQECRDFFQLIKSGTIQAYTCNIVLAEVLWTLKSFYKLPKNDQIDALNSIVRLHGLQMIDIYDTSLALTYYEKHNIKYIDALLATIPLVQNRQIPIVSYDIDFDKLNVIRKTPKDYVNY